METTVIDIWAGPGCGKSVLAADVYSMLSKMGSNVELVREYAKSYAWRGHKIEKWDEVEIFSRQLQAEAELYGKVAYIVSDRPLGMSSIYAQLYSDDSGAMMCSIVDAVMHEQERNGIHHVPFILPRMFPYIQEGRFETAQQAIAVDVACKSLLAGKAAVVQSAEQIVQHFEW